MKRLTVKDIKAKKNTTPIVCLTSYSAPFTKIIDEHADLILVGDSVGMVLYGMESTLGVSIDMMCNHGKCVVDSSSKSCVVVDMPFGSYQESKELAFKNASEILKRTGCAAVKIEGGTHMEETVSFLTERGIAVMGHIGLQPQSVNKDGGYRYHGKTLDEREKIIEDARALERAGAFAIVLEGITMSLANEITLLLSIPTIGIGASKNCDGQVLVTEDMAGLLGSQVPKFVKLYGNMAEELENSVKSYASDVRLRKFPEKENCFDIVETVKIKEVIY